MLEACAGLAHMRAKPLGVGWALGDGGFGPDMQDYLSNSLMSHAHILATQIGLAHGVKHALSVQ